MMVKIMVYVTLMDIKNIDTINNITPTEQVVFRADNTDYHSVFSCQDRIITLKATDFIKGQYTQTDYYVKDVQYVCESLDARVIGDIQDYKYGILFNDSFETIPESDLSGW